MMKNEKDKNVRDVIIYCLGKSQGTIFILTTVIVTELIVFALYGLTFEPLIYAFIITFAVFTVYFIVQCIIEYRYLLERKRKLSAILTEWNFTDKPKNIEQSDYFLMIKILGDECTKITESYANEHSETLDYYTAWVHQIKTPISVMKMILNSDDTDTSRDLSAELFRIEQYVDMVLQYIRLDSPSNDFVFREVEIDTVIRQAIRKYASQFIVKKLAINYEGTEITAVSDQKWLSCILEQIISNAVKYTNKGTVTISAEDNRIIVKDTGIGIREEDIPRIFEKGFTGGNGRINSQSSGLGLYLCKKAAEKICMDISVTSTVGKGSIFIIEFNNNTMT